MDFFSSVEFYVIAITMAVVAVGAVLNKKPESSCYTYIYAGEIEEKEPYGEECVLVRSLGNGMVEVRHCNVAIPVDVEGVKLRVDVAGEGVLCVEKFAAKSLHNDVAICDVVFNIKCLKSITYKVRYESEHNGRWCNISFTNNGVDEERKELKL